MLQGFDGLLYVATGRELRCPVHRHAVSSGSISAPLGTFPHIHGHGLLRPRQIEYMADGREGEDTIGGGGGTPVHMLEQIFWSGHPEARTEVAMGW